MSKVAKGAALLSAVARAQFFKLRKNPISYWDVGARWGLSKHMAALYRLGFISPTFFEPDPKEASRLRDEYKNSEVINYGLSNKDGASTLWMTHEPGQSSLLKPIESGMIAGSCDVQTMRADTLLKSHGYLCPEIIKLDIQGSELAALEGMGSYLDKPTCLEVEVSFQRSYENQPLIDDITGFLMGHGFGLFDVQIFGVRSTRAAIDANAFYSRKKLRNERDRAIESVFCTINRIKLAH